MIVSEQVFRRLVAIVALILALVSLAVAGSPYLAFAVILLAVLLLL